MKRLNVLLTGGAGFIGSHLAESLVRDSHNVAVLDNLDPFYSPQQKLRNLKAVSAAGAVRVYAHDIRDYDSLRSVFVSEQPDIVVHLAALAGVRPSLLAPELYRDVNVAGTENLLKLAAAFGVGRFVFASSSSVYGDAAPVPFREDEYDLQPISPYAQTKLDGERLCAYYARRFGLSTICLRLFTVYGPRQRPDLAIHKFLSGMEAGEALTLYGQGDTSRDYTFVADTVKGIRAAMDLDRRFVVINLGSARPVSLMELVETLAAVCGNKPTLKFGPPQPGDVVRTWADISKARELLKFEPATNLADGLAKFVDWFRQLEPERAIGSAVGSRAF